MWWVQLQQLLYFGLKDLPVGALSNWVGLEMNWTNSASIQWFYKISFEENRSSTPWTLYGEFTPPKIQNHYWDAGLFYVGALDPPNGFAYFYQFGVWSAYPVTEGNWQVLIQCPRIYFGGSWACISKAAYVSGLHSYWKVIYTFGENYPGINFLYLGNYEVKFFYSGTEKSPQDGTMIW